MGTPEEKNQCNSGSIAVAWVEAFRATILRGRKPCHTRRVLERVLLGTLGLDVQQGQLVFRRQELEGRNTSNTNG